ncbi:MAG: hypothetical protein GWP06_02800 [Actinobacteria bacterium]|nr:hypothetical protein [Actinomycetota bacterium]
MRKRRTDKERLHIVERCNSAEENGEKTGDILKELGASSSQLCQWRKKFNGKPKIPAEVFEEFGVDELEEEAETESGRLSIQNQAHRENVIVALVMSGYRVWQEVENGNYFIYYE